MNAFRFICYGPLSTLPSLVTRSAFWQENWERKFSLTASSLLMITLCFTSLSGGSFYPQKDTETRTSRNPSAYWVNEGSRLRECPKGHSVMEWGWTNTLQSQGLCGMAERKAKEDQGLREGSSFLCAAHVAQPWAGISCKTGELQGCSFLLELQPWTLNTCGTPAAPVSQHTCQSLS